MRSEATAGCHSMSSSKCAVEASNIGAAVARFFMGHFLTTVNTNIG